MPKIFWPNEKGLKRGQVARKNKKEQVRELKVERRLFNQGGAACDTFGKKRGRGKNEKAGSPAYQ